LTGEFVTGEAEMGADKGFADNEGAEVFVGITVGLNAGVRVGAATKGIATPVKTNCPPHPKLLEQPC
jgi:hypothetical protein